MEQASLHQQESPMGGTNGRYLKAPITNPKRLDHCRGLRIHYHNVGGRL